MIDAHCHLEQGIYHKDRDAIVQSCKAAGLKAIVTSCAKPQDFGLTMDIVKKHRDFVFPTVGIHPEFIKETTSKQVDELMDKIREKKSSIIGIGEVGLDFYWIRQGVLQRKQKELFVSMIAFAKELKKPLVIHARDAYEDALRILENEDARRVQLHMFGENGFVQRVIEDGYMVSMNAIVLKSKKHRKIVRDMPPEKLMLETDAPWLAPEGWSPDGKPTNRNDPRAIRVIAEKIAEIKKIDFEEVWQQCGRNARDFFELSIRV